MPFVRWLMLPSSRNTGRWYALLVCRSVAACGSDVGLDISEDIAGTIEDEVLGVSMETVSPSEL